jgi:hypothetical protein
MEREKNRKLFKGEKMKQKKLPMRTTSFSYKGKKITVGELRKFCRNFVPVSKIPDFIKEIDKEHINGLSETCSMILEKAQYLSTTSPASSGYNLLLQKLKLFLSMIRQLREDLELNGQNPADRREKLINEVKDINEILYQLLEDEIREWKGDKQ